MNSKFPRALCACLLLSFLCACTPKTISTDPHNSEAAKCWERFAARAAAMESGNKPFRISANLRYNTPEGESTRAAALLWGNGKDDANHTLRLDLLAPGGTVAAKIREDDRQFLAYSPGDNMAYFHARGPRSLLSFGVPIPLTMHDFTLLLNGRLAPLFLPEKSPAVMPSQYGCTPNGFLFEVYDTKLPGMLELSPDGAPLSWREFREEGWNIAFTPSDGNPLQPRKLTVEHPKGWSATVVVKSVEQTPPFSDERLALPLPPGTMNKQLEEHY